MVTVIMPAYNCEKYLKDAVESVKAQSCEQWVLLIIDDCSTDGTGALAEELAAADERIRVLHNEKNCGVGRTRNRGIQEASSEWIAFLDSDDVWEPDKLERQLKIACQGADLVYCSYDLIDQNGKPIRRPFLVPEETDFRSMLSSNAIGCSTTLIRTSILKDHLFNPEVFHEDYLLWMELLKEKYTARGDRKVLSHYRQVSGAKNIRKGNAAKERWRIYREYLQLDWCTSALAFFGYAIKGILKYYF